MRNAEEAKVRLGDIVIDAAKRLEGNPAIQPPKKGPTEKRWGYFVNSIGTILMARMGRVTGVTSIAPTRSGFFASIAAAQKMQHDLADEIQRLTESSPYRDMTLTISFDLVDRASTWIMEAVWSGAPFCLLSTIKAAFNELGGLELREGDYSDLSSGQREIALLTRAYKYSHRFMLTLAGALVIEEARGIV